MHRSSADRMARADEITALGDIVGWVASNGAGEVIFKQVGHPMNDAYLDPTYWKPVVLHKDV